MEFSLLICTYMRAKPIVRLLESVKKQTFYPNEILIIDGSIDNETETILNENAFKNLIYYKVNQENRGLTKQRNFGISKLSQTTKIVCFLDDDTVLEVDYFEKVIQAFNNNPDAIGIGGVAINENKWKLNTNNIKQSSKYYTIDNYFIKESLRNYLRNILGLASNKMPGVLPEFSNGKTCSYPLNGKDYPVDLIIGMSMSFKKELFNKIKFSTYFEGYGLYEDADFSLRALQYGQNYIATTAKLFHYHDNSGRPNKYNYGKMVLRNGWYVWRVKFPNPSFQARLKWNLISLLLLFIRFTNCITTNKPKEAFTESLGRTVGFISLVFNKPILDDK